MSQQRSLSDEKEALLARMEASRVAYRRMLLGIDDIDATTVRETRQANSFPRSKTFRWIRDHPYLAATAVAATVAVLAIGPRRVARTAVRNGRAAATTVSRNSGKIRVAFGLATAVARILMRRR